MDKCHTSEPDTVEIPTDRAIVEIPGVPLEPILRSHGWVYLAPMEKTAAGFQYPVVLGSGVSVTIIVAASKTGTVFRAGTRAPARQRRGIQAIVEHMLSLDFPLHEFEALHAEYAQKWVPECEGLDRADLAEVLAEAVVARNGWKRILGLCSSSS